MRPPIVVPALVSTLVLAACEIETNPGSTSAATDSAGAAASTATAATAASLDSAALGGTGTGTAAATGTGTGTTAGGTASAGDSASLDLWPAQPRRGGVVWARLRGAGDGSPRCTWNGQPMPCHSDGGDALLVVPLPADAPAGTFALGIEAGGARVTRSVQVSERDFGRELVFLDRRTYALTQDAGAIARDGRAVRAVLANESAERRWGSSAWREPRGGRSAGYGAERFYYLASDSSRAIRLGADARTSASFGADTSTAPRPKDGTPAWRHAGVDLPLAKGARVEAPAAAVVADVGQYQLTGRTLLLDHGQGVFSAWFHLDTVTVRKGDVVRAGQAMARVGSTGLSTGPHLHYGIYVHGRDVDPAAWRDMPPWLAGGTSTASADSARARR
jgi:murein DD-endopeptidase MepM/ murein hydrolase activator NlpD